MRSLVKVVIVTFVVLFVASQFMPDVIQVPNHWPPRLPKIEFVHAGVDVGTPVAAGLAAPDSLAGKLPAIAAAPSLDAAQEARKAKRAEAAARKKAAKRPARKPARSDDSEEASWFEPPTAMIVPVRITTEVQLSKPAGQPAAPTAEATSGEDWPVVCGVVVDALGDPVANATVQIEGTDENERTDHKGRFCLASQSRRVTLVVDGGERGNVRYVVELEGRTTQARVTLR